MSKWDEIGKLLSMIPKKADDVAKAVDGPGADVIGDGGKLTDYVDKIAEQKWIAQKVERAQDTMMNRPGNVGIEDFMLARGRTGPRSEQDTADYYQWTKELSSEGFIPKDSWAAKYGFGSTGQKDMIGKLASSQHRKLRGGLDGMADLARELAAKVEGGGTLTPQEEQMFEIASEEAKRMAKQLNVRNPYDYNVQMSPPGAEVKPFPFKLDTLKKNITDKQPDLLTPNPKEIEKTHRAWMDAASDSDEELELSRKLDEMRNPTLKRINGGKIDMDSLGQNPIANMNEKQKQDYITGLYQKRDSFPVGSPEWKEANESVNHMSNSFFNKTLKALAPAALTPSPLESMRESAGNLYDKWGEIKDKLASKIVDAADFTPASARLTDEEKKQQADIMAMFADPLNLIEGPAGIGLGLSQLLAKEPKK